MNNTDLEAIEREIAERKNAVATVEEKPVAPVIQFEKNTEKKEVTNGKDTAGELVESALNQAIVHKVTSDKGLQNEMLDIAGNFVKNKSHAIKERADQEDKEAYFNNKKNACECFGYNEATTEKWAVKVMNFWHNIMTAIWLFIGFFTFAPITFVAKKITVIFKKSRVAITLAIIIYLIVVVGIPLLTSLINK